MAEIKFSLKTLKEMEDFSETDIDNLTEQDAKKHLVTAIAGIKKLRQDLDDLGTEKQNLEKAHQDLVDANTGLQTQKTNLEQEKQTLLDLIQQKKDELANLVASEKTLAERLGTVNDNLEKEKGQVKQITKQNEIIMEQLEDFTKSNKKLQTEVDNMRAEMGVQVQTRHDYEERVGKLKGQINDLQEENHQLDLKRMGSVSDLRNERKQSEKFQYDLNTMHGQYDELMKEYTKMSDACNTLVEEMDLYRKTGKIPSSPPYVPPVPKPYVPPTNPSGGSKPPDTGSKPRYEGPQTRISECIPRRFSGIKGQDPRAHIFSFEDYCRLQHLTDESDKIERFKVTLGDQARLWIESVKAKTFQEVKESFVRQYTGVTTYDANVQRFRNVVYTPPESLENYKQRLMLLGQTIGYDTRDGNVSREVCTQYRLGMPHKIRMFLASLAETASLEELQEHAQKYIDIDGLSPEVKTPTQVTFGDSTTQNALVSQGQSMSKNTAGIGVNQGTSKENENIMQQLNELKALIAMNKERFDRSRSNSKGRLDSRNRSKSPQRDRNYRPQSRSPNRNRSSNEHSSRKQASAYTGNDYRNNGNNSRRDNGNDRSYSRDRYQSNRGYDRGRSQSRDRNDDRGRNNSRDRGRPRNDSRDGPRKRELTPFRRSPSNDTLKCHFCHQKGHFYRNCPELWDSMMKAKKAQGFQDSNA